MRKTIILILALIVLTIPIVTTAICQVPEWLKKGGYLKYYAKIDAIIIKSEGYITITIKDVKPTGYITVDVEVEGFKELGGIEGLRKFMITTPTGGRGHYKEVLGVLDPKKIAALGLKYLGEKTVKVKAGTFKAKVYGMTKTTYIGGKKYTMTMYLYYEKETGIPIKLTSEFSIGGVKGSVHMELCETNMLKPAGVAIPTTLIIVIVLIIIVIAVVAIVIYRRRKYRRIPPPPPPPYYPPPPPPPPSYY